MSNLNTITNTNTISNTNKNTKIITNTNTNTKLNQVESHATKFQSKATPHSVTKSTLHVSLSEFYSKIVD